MSTHAEDVLYLALTDTDSLETLSQIGLAEEAIPTEEMRPVVVWAIDRFFESGRTVAPTRTALLDTWGQRIEDAGIELLPDDEDVDNITWAIDMLKAQYVKVQHDKFVRTAAHEMAAAAPPDKVKTLAVHSDVLFALSMSVQPRHMQVEVSRGIIDALAAYEAREREGHLTRGIVFGLPDIDDHTYGIHEGEVGIFAAGPKVGKSYGIAWAAKECWKQGHDTVLVTMENSVEMTIDRIVCMELMIDSRRWQRGQCVQDEKDKVARYINDVLPNASAKLHVIMPEPGKRTMASIVRQTQLLGSRRLFIDQLTFVDHPDPGRKNRNEIIRDQMHDLKTLVATGNEPIAAMMAHQINRVGVEAARTRGYHVMEHMAESSEVERTADWVFSVYQKMDGLVGGEAIFQILAARREELNAWEITWQPSAGVFGVTRSVDVTAINRVPEPEAVPSSGRRP